MSRFWNRSQVSILSDPRTGSPEYLFPLEHQNKAVYHFKGLFQDQQTEAKQ